MAGSRTLNRLTETAVRNAKIGDTLKKLSDGGSLQLWIQPTGSKLWRFAYRHRGKQKLLSLGQYPIVGLSDARAKRDDAKRLLANDIDPSKAKRDARIEADNSATTFKTVADEYVAKLEREGRAEATLKKVSWYLDLAMPALGHRTLNEIRPADVLIPLKSVEGRGCYETARRMRSTISAVFRYAVATARAETDPAGPLKGALTTGTAKHRAAITKPAEFGALLRAIDTFAGQPTTNAALKLMALLFSRPGELRQAEWSEFDLEKAIWTIPAARAKMRREHRKPLSRQAIEILVGLRQLTGRHDLVFPSLTSWKRPISENTLNGALRRLGYSKDEATAHGFRASASTLLNESGKWSADAVERELGHVESNEVRRAYARGENFEERREMTQWWADYCESLKAEPSR